MSSDPENPNQISTYDRMRRAITKAVHEGIDRSKQCCPNCACWTESNNYCKVERANPPPRIVAFGCKAFVPSDEIPF